MSMQQTNRLTALEARFDALFADAPDDDRLDRLEAEVAALRAELETVKSTYARKRSTKAQSHDTGQTGYLTGAQASNYLTR